MKISLDLLPDIKKEKMKRKRNIKIILKHEILFLLPVVLFLATLFSINVILNVQLESARNIYLSVSSQGDYQNLEKYKEEFKNINKSTKSVLKFEETHIIWSDILKNISNMMPKQIYIEKINTDDRKFFLSGKADRRESLIDLQNKLSNSECYENVDVPLSSLVSKENVEFQMNFEVKSKCLMPN